MDEDGEVGASPPSGLLDEGGFDFDDALEDAGRKCVESGGAACAIGGGEGGGRVAADAEAGIGTSGCLLVGVRYRF